MPMMRANMRKQMEGKMKTCAACKSPTKCKKAGKCMAKGYKEGGILRAGAMGLAGKAIDKFGMKALSPAAMLMDGSTKKKKNEPISNMDGSKGSSVAYKKGGKVRGCGKAKRGVRKAKMY